MKTTPQQELFADEYIVDFNATRAAGAAGYACPGVHGSRLLATVRVRMAIQKRLDAAHAQAGVPSAAEVIRRLNAIAWADVRELQQVTYHACRHCHGPGFAFQWRSEQEWAEAVEKAIGEHESKMRSHAKRNDETPPPTLALPSSEGGFEFDPKLLPVDACPKCDGVGKMEITLADTRFLSGDARYLYGGVKQTKDGLQIVIKDQLKAIELVMRHRGLLNDKLIHITPGGAGAIDATPEELAALTPAQLDAIIEVHDAILKSREQKEATLALARPAQHGDVVDV